MLLSEIIFTFVLSIIFCNFSEIEALEENERCGPRGTGICKHICSCQLALDMIKKGKVPNLPICGFKNEKYPVVCCYNSNLNENKEQLQSPGASVSQIMCNEYYNSICESKHQKSFRTCLTAVLGEVRTFGAVGGQLAYPKELSFMVDCNEYYDNICRPYLQISMRNCEISLSGGIPPSSAVGGLLVFPKELPFMGLVGYQVRNQVEWACGSSLISDKFVLTAAHCTKHPIYGFARIVRLGELDYSTKNETSFPTDFKIIKHINHPNYQSQYVYYDIALFLLDRKVDFNEFIRPICLPTLDSFKNVNTVFGAGWGRTDFVGPLSSALIKVNLDYLRIDQCSRTVDRTVMPQGLDKDSMICAGVLEGGRDTCTGDSGGPLYLPPSGDMNACFLYTQIGITSFGKNCALEGYPGVYTNVHYYVQWIESVVWPENDTESQRIW